jgi:hypothetical protein
VKTIFAVVSISLAFATAARSQQSESPTPGKGQTSLGQGQQSFKAIIGNGYAIKDSIFAKVGGRDMYVVTLAKEQSIAVCNFPVGNWINLSDNYLEDPNRCELRQ